MRIIVTGTGGRLGAAVARRLREQHAVVAWDRKAMDLRSPDQIEDHFRAVEFDAVIHCAAVTSLDYCEQHAAEAWAVNAAAPAQIAHLCLKRGARMVQVSTDYVYDGRQAGLRMESDPCEPLGIYARSKREGELAVLAASPGFLVARASWIFGPDRSGFADQIIDRCRKENHAEAISDKFSNPSYSIDQAAFLEALVMNPGARGVVNLCNAGACSWLEYGQAALEFAEEHGIRLKCRTLSPRDCASMPGFLASRPVHTGMDVRLLEEWTGLRVRPWRAALAEYIATYYGRAVPEGT